jgi:hypothetical protein
LAEGCLWRNPYLALDVSCACRGGVLVLRGCLPSHYLKQLAQEVVARLEGVQSIDNQIQVVPPVSRSGRDWCGQGSEATTTLRQPEEGPTMTKREWISKGWFYREAGEAVGPVSAERLKELLDGGQLGPHQTVWRRGEHYVLFIHAAKAAGGSEGTCRQAPPPESRERLDRTGS